MNILRITLVLLMLLSVSAALAQSPFQKGGEIICWVSCIGESGNMPQAVPKEITEHYSQTIGAYPNYIHWTTIPDNATVKAFVKFTPSRNLIQDPPWWGSSLTYGQLRPYLRAFMISVETGDTIDLSLSQDSLSAVISTGVGYYEKSFSVPFNNLPIPNGDSAWEIHLTPQVNPDSVAVNVRTVIVAEKAPSVTLDTLAWSLANDDSGVSLAFNRRVLSVYPYYINYLVNMFEYFYLTSPNCDSVEYYGDRLIDTIELDLDPVEKYRAKIWGKNEAEAEMLINHYKEMIHDICVDGYPQPEKYEIPSQ